jgi:uncharacterized protein YbjQ (UPF0145 family)
MKKLASFVLIASLFIGASPLAFAEDVQHKFTYADALQVKSDKDRLQGTVKFYFGTQKHPKVLANFGTDSFNRKTNAFGKEASVACSWALYSALVSLERAAMGRGANAVINIRSFYKSNEMSSETEYECYTGAIMAGVALKGDFVKIAEK